MAFTCKTCGFDLWSYICPVMPSEMTPTAHLGLYNDARFPGRCILAHEVHETALEAMAPGNYNTFMTNVRLAAVAIRVATGAAKVNVAILGNTVDHVHAHLIPRYPSFDVNPTKSPWDDPRDRLKQLTTEEAEWLVWEIAAALLTIPQVGIDHGVAYALRQQGPVEHVRAMLEAHWPPGGGTTD